jgi:phosphate transport system substrate-binding protein
LYSPMKRYCTTVVLIGMLLAVLSGAADAETVIEVGGTGSALGSLRLLAAAYTKNAPGTLVHVLPSIGSSGAIKAVSKNALAVGIISRPLKPKELDLDLTVIEYAKTPFVAAVHRNVPVTGVTTEILVNIYSARTATWPNGERIRLVLRPASDTDTHLMRSISPRLSEAVSEALSRKGMLMALTDQDAADLIEKTPGAFGFSTMTQVVAEKRKLKMLTLNGMVPGTGKLAAGTYPYSKTFSFVIKSDPPEPVRKFLDFVFSPEGRKILEQSGNVPLGKRDGN